MTLTLALSYGSEKDVNAVKTFVIKLKKYNFNRLY
jgi:hypothetical protein